MNSKINPYPDFFVSKISIIKSMMERKESTSMKKLFNLFPLGFTILLAGCQEETLDGTWKLTSYSPDECPVMYKFRDEKQKAEDSDKTILVKVVDMYTNSTSKEDKYTGTYSLTDKSEDKYFIDYGNSFTVTQRMVQEDNELKMIFEDVGRTCTYIR
jgi:hypothetical protein